MRYWVVLFFTILVAYSCHRTFQRIPESPANTGWKVREIPATPQFTDGDPEKGLRYLLYGNYIGTGIPWSMMAKRLDKNSKDTVFNRDGINGKLPYVLTAFEARNGTMVVNGNCFACHAGKINVDIIPGMGNSFSDFTHSLKPLSSSLTMIMKAKHRKDTAIWEDFDDFSRYLKASAPYVKTNQWGGNPAAVLAEACVRFRDPITLEYTGKPNYEMTDYPVGTDVPALWHLKKKNALYYTAIGRGDFSKLLFQASVLGIPDSAAAREAVTNFRDVIAWIKTLTPPPYPQGNGIAPIDPVKAENGKTLFEQHCQSCHGSYGENPTYPNKVVSVDLVKTDPLYAGYAASASIVSWYNQSWFARSQPLSWFEPEAGYVAPPLDGIWATAPYLHNGSVPTLDDLLNSYQRPAYWQRSGDSSDFDYQKVGWNYTRNRKPGGKWTFDTTLPGYSNQGHTFGDFLTPKQRSEVIEYLKTL